MKQPIKVMHGGKTKVYISDNPIPVEQAMENIGRILSRIRGENVTLVRRDQVGEQV